MLSTYFIASLIIFSVFAGWVGVQHLARRFAARHPEFGAAREEGGGCGISCGCAGIKDCPLGNRPDATREEGPPLNPDHHLNPNHNRGPNAFSQHSGAEARRE